MITSDFKQKVKRFCAQIGADPLLVQGAGGNVSWKEEESIWIKASGKWLANAETDEIFVKVDHKLLLRSLKLKDFNVVPKVMIETDLRPSIETHMHSLLPHKIVIHVHAIEVLACLVQINARENLEKVIGNTFNWTYVDYFKPGAELAEAVSEEMYDNCDVVFLGNHGLVIGVNNIDDAYTLLNELTLKLTTKPEILSLPDKKFSRKLDFSNKGYVPVIDEKINLIATDYKMASKLQNRWALYPDHVVFLGAKPVILKKGFTIEDLNEATFDNPPFIFSLGEGVYESVNSKNYHRVQLRCYYDVIIRLKDIEKVLVLNEDQISELLNWDAEAHRQNLQ
jgi:rhamnose utilization protein RhaD (predicted bifunctional aldolase and dehydrogenase)